MRANKTIAAVGGSAAVAPERPRVNKQPPAVPPPSPVPQLPKNDDVPGWPIGKGLDRVVSFFTSLRLTVVCLALGIVLIFWGTLAQVEMGTLKAQNEFFRSFFIYWAPKGAGWKIPIFPGGYLVGGVLLINLVAAHIQRFSFTRKKAGIWLVHFGIILLLLGQLLTDKLARESILHLREGETRNYTESVSQVELAVIDTTDPTLEQVVAIPQGVLTHQKEIRRPELPFVVRVKDFFPNAQVDNRTPGSSDPPAATQGVGAAATVRPLPRVTEMNLRDVPSAVVEFVTPQGSLGTWLASEQVRGSQEFACNNHTYQFSLRLRRFYKPYSIQLLQFRHDVYAGTEIPKNFSSRVLLEDPDRRVKREVPIYMNNPLRYAGETYYQADWDKDDHGTILQVVRNPSWLTPYLSCILVAAGLLVQFTTHLVGFVSKRKVA
jgi:ResB-like family protein